MKHNTVIYSKNPVSYNESRGFGNLSLKLKPFSFAGECVELIQKQAAELELPVQVFEFVAKKPVVVVTWIGLQPDLPAIMLNSHMDVVPVNEVRKTITDISKLVKHTTTLLAWQPKENLTLHIPFCATLTYFVGLGVLCNLITYYSHTRLSSFVTST